MKLAVLLSSILVLSGASSAAPISPSVLVSAAPLLPTSPIGATATVPIAISGLALHAAPSLGAYDLDLAFDPAVLSFTGLTFGDPMQGDQLDLSGVGSISDTISSSGSLEFYEISLDPATLLDSQQSDHFVLATALFQAISVGDGGLSLSINSIADSEGSPLTIDLQTASLQVVAVPEPNTFLLLLPIVALLITHPARRLPQVHETSQQS